MKRVWYISTLVLSMFFSGCALLEPTNPYTPAGVAGDVSLSSPTGPKTVYRPHRSVRKIAGALTLDRAIEVALANNPGVSARSWEVRTARARRDMAVAERWPWLSATGGYTRYLDRWRLVPARAPMEPGTYSENIFSGDLVISMPLFTGGRIINEIRASELLEESAAHRLSRTKKELVFDVASVFYGILGQRRVIESLSFSRKALSEHRRRIADMISVQKASRVDLLRTEVRLSDIEQKLVREKNILAIQRRVLANLLGIDDPDGAVTVKGSLGLKQVGLDIRSNLAKAFGLRSDYRAARSELEAQARRVDVARAGRWPTVSLQGSYGGRWAAGGAVRQSGASRSEDMGSLGVMVNVPIFEGGAIEANIRKERTKLYAARQQLRKLELQIRLDVQTAILNIQSNRERVRATEKAIAQAKESLRIEREKYRLGKGSITDVLDAQSALLDSQTNYYRALAAFNTSIAQLKLAVGEMK